MTGAEAPQDAPLPEQPEWGASDSPATPAAAPDNESDSSTTPADESPTDAPMLGPTSAEDSSSNNVSVFRMLASLMRV